jgi:hypothetical protein
VGERVAVGVFPTAVFVSVAVRVGVRVAVGVRVVVGVEVAEAVAVATGRPLTANSSASALNCPPPLKFWYTRRDVLVLATNEKLSVVHWPAGEVPIVSEGLAASCCQLALTIWMRRPPQLGAAIYWLMRTRAET